MKLTLTCDCGNVETIEINQKRMREYVLSDDTLFIDDFELNNQKFNHEQTNPDYSTLKCSRCDKFVDIML